MRVFYTANGISDYCKKSGQDIGFVPTMGALHQGHLDLVRLAKAHQTAVVVSVFVNPKQFNNPEDLKKYPRTISNDLKLLEQAGVDAVFVPNVSEIYPQNIENNNPNRNDLILENLDAVWEGKFRPGHFSGVVDVVRRLFQITQPKQVYFGQKDLQQCLVIERLIQSEFPGVSMNFVQTKRELSGLAMSSRNMRLSEGARMKAAAIFQALNHIEQDVRMGFEQLKATGNFQINQPRPINEILKAQHEALFDLDIETEYLNLISVPSMVEVNDFNDLINSDLNKRIKLAIIFSGYLEGVRLIDNVTFEL